MMTTHPNLSPDKTYTPEEQRELVRRYQEEGDEQAGDLLVESNMPWVIEFVSGLSHSNAHPDDLIQAGAEALCKARDKYDPNKNTNFLSYAQYWIKSYTTRTTWESYTVRRERGRCGRKISNQLAKARKKLQKQDKKTTLRNLAEEMEVDIEDLRKYKLVDGLTSLNQPVGDKDATAGETELGDLLQDEKALDPVEVCDTKRLMALLKNLNLFDGEESVGDLSTDMLQFFSSRRYDVEHTLRLIGEYSDRLEGRAADIWENRIIAPDPDVLRKFSERWDVTQEAIRLHENRLKQKFVDELLERYGIDIDWS